MHYNDFAPKEIGFSGILLEFISEMNLNEYLKSITVPLKADTAVWLPNDPFTVTETNQDTQFICCLHV